MSNTVVQMTTQAISATEGSAMQGHTRDISKARLWLGRVLGTLAALFFVMDGGMKLFKPPFVIQATTQLGYPESTILGIGLALLVCTALYAIPRTAVWGAILLTGYLGGAIASKVRIGAPVFDIAFALGFAVVVWAALVLRDKRLQRVLFATE